MPNRLKKIPWRAIGRYFIVGFLLHLVWEYLQAPLFADFADRFWPHLWTCFLAAATGDNAFMLAIYALLAIVHRDAYWVARSQHYSHPATWVIPVVVGALLAVSFELWAVYVDERWVYGAMPVVPVLEVGLTPLLQMVVVPTLTLLACVRSRFMRPQQTCE